MRKKAKFGIGDKVRIVGYGSCMMMHKESLKDNPSSWPVVAIKGNIAYIDTMPQLVGKVGLISKVDGGYAIEGIREKHAWYNADQLEMVAQNPNR